ncbi:Protein GCY-17 [Aphelenchoides avenae]|nr:Protein GCY-17 [Aphelenchus avenae]
MVRYHSALVLLRIFRFTLLVIHQLGTQAERTIKVGLLMPDGVEGVENYSGFRTSAGALTIGLQRVIDEGILPGTNFTFVWYFDQCDESLAIAYTMKLIKKDQVDVVIGPTCSDAIVTSAVMSRAFDFPMVEWGPIVSGKLEDRERFPTLIMNSGNARS